MLIYEGDAEEPTGASENGPDPEQPQRGGQGTPKPYTSLKDNPETDTAA